MLPRASIGLFGRLRAMARNRFFGLKWDNDQDFRGTSLRFPRNHGSESPNCAPIAFEG